MVLFGAGDPSLTDTVCYEVYSWAFRELLKGQSITGNPQTQERCVVRSNPMSLGSY